MQNFFSPLNERCNYEVHRQTRRQPEALEGTCLVDTGDEACMPTYFVMRWQIGVHAFVGEWGHMQINRQEWRVHKS